IGVACPPAGSAPFHNSLPVSMSNARRYWSIAAAMNTSPPAVMIEPPRFGEPHADEPGTRAKLGIVPSGTCQRSFPLDKSIAVSVPHGGALHRTPLRVRRTSRRIAYGVPV